MRTYTYAQFEQVWLGAPHCKLSSAQHLRELWHQAVPPVLVMAKRHGEIMPTKKGEVYKVSFRGWVTNYAVEYTRLKDIIVEAGQGGLFDTTVYKANEQLLGCIGCCKGHVKPGSYYDARVLVPLEQGLPITAYIAQVVDPQAAVWRDVEAEEVAVGEKGGEVGEELGMCVKLVEMLSAERADTYGSWINVGICLSNMADELFDAWVAFSKRSSKYADDGTCEDKWNSFVPDRENGVQIGSLHYWAKEDSPEAYAAMKSGGAGAMVVATTAVKHRGSRLIPTAEQAYDLTKRIFDVMDLRIPDFRITEVYKEDDKVMIHVDDNTASSNVYKLDLEEHRAFKMSSSCEILCDRYLHHKTPIPVVGGDLSAVHKDIRSGLKWECIRPTENVAQIQTQDLRSRIEMLNMNIPDRMSVKLKLDDVKTAKITNKKDIAFVMETYTASLKHAAITQYGLGWAVNVTGDNHSIVAHVNNLNITLGDGDASNVTHQDLIDELVKVFPDTMEKFVFCPLDIRDGRTNSMYYCDPRTNIWGLVHNTFIEYHLVKSFRRLSSEQKIALGPKERKLVESIPGRSQLRQVLSQMVQLPTFCDNLDGNLDLLAVKNGVFDMSLPGYPLRPIKPEDMVSEARCCGWSYDEAEAREYRPALERFLEQVMPVAEERSVAISFIATLMSGDRAAKRFMILTDQSGGNNGKSAFCDLVRGFFGGYSRKDGKKFVTRPAVERGGRNDHDAGTQNYKGVRLLVAEKLKKRMLLDEGVLKDLTSPHPTLEGRKFGQDITFRYKWTAGFLLIFNQNDCPQADPADEAFWERVIVVPFRSKFLPKEEITEDAEPYTFPRDTMVGKMFPHWYSALADVLREAFDPREEALAHIPESMRNWKHEIMATNNPVVEWIEEAIEFTGNVKEDRMAFDTNKMAELYTRFSDGGHGARTDLREFKSLFKAYMVEKKVWRTEMSLRGQDGKFRNYKGVGVVVKMAPRTAGLECEV